MTHFSFLFVFCLTMTLLALSPSSVQAGEGKKENRYSYKSSMLATGDIWVVSPNRVFCNLSYIGNVKEGVKTTITIYQGNTGAMVAQEDFILTPKTTAGAGVDPALIGDGAPYFCIFEMDGVKEHFRGSIKVAGDIGSDSDIIVVAAS